MHAGLVRRGLYAAVRIQVGLAIGAAEAICR